MNTSLTQIVDRKPLAQSRWTDNKGAMWTRCHGCNSMLNLSVKENIVHIQRCKR